VTRSSRTSASSMTSRSPLASSARGAGEVTTVLLAAALMVVSGLDHLHLWDIAYRHVATLGPLFLVQTVAAFVGAVALVLTRLVVVMAASALLMLGTIVGFILAATVGLFGFTLPEVTWYADVALVSEALSALLLVLVVVRHRRVVGAVAPA
jgi:hypothetical protein